MFRAPKSAWPPPRVIIGKGDISRLRRCNADSARRGTSVALEHDQAELGKKALHERRRTVVRSVVDHHDARSFRQRSQSLQRSR